MTTINRGLRAAFLIGVVTTFAVAQTQLPSTKTETMKGNPSVTTQQLQGTVVHVEGNQLVVKMSTGEIRTFQVSPSRKFIIDGREMSVNELQIGTTLTATTTTKTTPVTERTTTIGSGKVWFVSGNTVIVTLPNGENKSYTVADSYRFNVDGRPASVHDLRRGMTVSAEKIVEDQRDEISTDTVVTGKAPAH